MAFQMFVKRFRSRVMQMAFFMDVCLCMLALITLVSTKRCIQHELVQRCWIYGAA